MRPIGWSKRSVHLECEACGSHARLELLPFLTVLSERRPLRCPGCGAVEVPEDRRQAAVAPTVERRVPVGVS